MIDNDYYIYLFQHLHSNGEIGHPDLNVIKRCRKPVTRILLNSNFVNSSQPSMVAGERKGVDMEGIVTPASGSVRFLSD